MAFDKAWPEPYPPEGGYIRDGNDQIRDGWYALRERLAVDHKFVQDESGHTDIGYHKQVTLIEAADIGTGATGLPILGAQTVSGKPELVYTNEDDVDIQITSGSGLYGNYVPAGVIVMWSGTIANIPTGWSLCDGDGSTPNLTEKMVRGVSSGTNPGGTGGADTHVHTGPSHTHTMSGSVGANTDVTGCSDEGGACSAEQVGKTHVHTIGSVATAAAGTGNTGSASTLPAYYAIAFIMKD